MAEGWARHLAPAGWTVMSAGIQAHGKNPRAIDVMGEWGIDISSQESEKLTDQMLTGLDRVITVCGHADQNCPVLAATIAKEHWPLEDPAKATGSDDEIVDVFRNSRDEIRKRVENLIRRLEKDHHQRTGTQ